MPTPRGRVIRSNLLLQKLMKEQKISCNQLGPAIGRSRQLVAHLAYGRRDSCNNETAERLASALGVGMDDLFLPAISDESSTRRKK
ncbi:helix-turn-helix transcriptional regulator [Streptomyces anulatus]|uniref:helix-turn-helix transcriptional regulator n=1 Tax=Streptomyces anulatus TaxID=1892 RepID=UPI003413BCFD